MFVKGRFKIESKSWSVIQKKGGREINKIRRGQIGFFRKNSMFTFSIQVTQTDKSSCIS